MARRTAALALALMVLPAAGMLHAATAATQGPADPLAEALAHAPPPLQAALAAMASAQPRAATQVGYAARDLLPPTEDYCAGVIGVLFTPSEPGFTGVPTEGTLCGFPLRAGVVMHATDGTYGAAYADQSLSHPAGQAWSGFAEYTAVGDEAAVYLYPSSDGTYFAYFMTDTGVIETE